MSARSIPIASKQKDLELLSQPDSQEGMAPAGFGMALHAMYERHLLLDNGVEPSATNAREHYEAFARSVRDILTHRWVETNRCYNRVNPKRIYYLSMEFLIGRSLANNVTNLLLDPLMKGVIDEKDVD